jgi:release factor glutamine methyltransferase
MTTAPTTAAEALAAAESHLRGAGVAEAALDAETLLRHALGWDRARLMAALREPLAIVPHRSFQGLVATRARRVPLQHILGVQAFWKQDFRVTPDVLIPRPETEQVVETALARLASRPAPLVADVGTGSGCIALSIAMERGDAVVHATDVSAAALEVAGDNARRLGLSHRVSFHRGDLLAPLAPLARRLDLVASNPPYVTATEVEALQPEVRDFEPRGALVPPEGPVALYDRLLAQAAQQLTPGGWIVLEMGAGQAADMEALAVRHGFEHVRTLPDLAGIARVLEAQRP